MATAKNSMLVSCDYLPSVASLFLQDRWAFMFSHEQKAQVTAVLRELFMRGHFFSLSLLS